MAFTVSLALELFLLLHLQLPRDSRRLLVQTYFSSTNAVGGQAFTCFPSWVVSVSVAFSRALSSLIWVGVGTFGYTFRFALLISQITAIFTGVDAIALFLFFPETTFVRNTDINSDESDSKSKPEHGNVHAVDTEEVPSSVKKSYLQELRPFSPIDKTKNYLLLLLRPIPIVLYPATIFSLLTFASTLGFVIAALTTCGAIFQGPPYNMSAAINGLINIPSFIGNLLGSYCGGGLTDKIAEWQARRNNGIFEPEARLIALVIPFVLVPAGILM